MGRGKCALHCWEWGCTCGCTWVTPDGRRATSTESHAPQCRGCRITRLPVLTFCRCSSSFGTYDYNVVVMAWRQSPNYSKSIFNLGKTGGGKIDPPRPAKQGALPRVRDRGSQQPSAHQHDEDEDGHHHGRVRCTCSVESNAVYPGVRTSQIEDVREPGGGVREAFIVHQPSFFCWNSNGRCTWGLRSGR